MKYLCLYNDELKETAYPIEVEDDNAAYDKWRYDLDAVNRGNGWKSYCGDVPYEFPEEPKAVEE